MTTASVCFLQKDLIHTIGESAALGAAGFVIWGDLNLTSSRVGDLRPSPKKLSPMFCEQRASGLTQILQLALSASLMHEEYLNTGRTCCCGGRSAVCSLLLRNLVVGTDDVRSFSSFKHSPLNLLCLFWTPDKPQL